MRLFLLILSVLTISHNALAQTDPAKLSNQYYSEGMDAFNFSHRKQAVDLFRLAVKANPKNTKACLMAGKSLMETIHKEEALPFFKRAYLLDRTCDEDILFLIGQAYHYNENFDSALWYYDKFNQLLSQSLQFSRVVKMNEVNWKIFECRNAMIYKSHPVGVTIEDLGTNVNSEWPDYAPTISADETTMIFTTRRPDNNANPSLADDLEYYEEIYMSRKVNGTWQPARKVDELNSTFHDASVSLSPDGKEMFVYSDENGGDIFETDLQADGTWSSPKRMGGLVNSTYLENSAAISADGSKLYFVSDRPDGYGGTDIYVALKGKRGDWAEVVNLGPIINTPRDEDDVFVSANGDHLYFSSNGHAGMGDLDIYRSTFDSITGKWSEPMNLGYPINSVENDIYFVMTGDERYAYISSFRASSRGEQDIYRIDLTNWKPQTREELMSRSLVPVHEQIATVISEPTTAFNTSKPEFVWRIQAMDEESRAPIAVRLSIDTTEGRKELNQVAPGIYECRDNLLDQRVSLRATADGFEPFHGEFLMPSSPSGGTLEQAVFLKRQSMARSTKPSFSLFYQSNEVKPLNDEVLDIVSSWMKENPTLRIRIAGHTDSNGDAAYNEQLSRKRSEEVCAQLVARGVAPARVEISAHGETMPLSTNATRSGRKINRRTELELLD